MERSAQKSLPLILAREFAANVAIPIFLVDADNTLVYYNDAAAVAFGGPFGNTGELRHGEWAARFNPTRPDGTAYDRKELPLVIALEERRPAHGVNLVSSPQGDRRLVEFSALPLYCSPEDFVGVLVAFWESVG
ncbi:MAG: PAS domain-containing protein [Actinomycetes bacterium]